MSEEHKILFTGPMGAGKTTAIIAVAGRTVLSTEAVNTDRNSSKPTTTVGFDYGEVVLPDGSVLRLYGTPGQLRFSFLWRVMSKGALGLVILMDNSRPDPLADLCVYLDHFSALVKSGVVVIGVGRTETHPRPSRDDYQALLQSRELMLPVFEVDVRKSEHVLMMLDVLFGMMEFSPNTAGEG
jgi:signal recognition particle receptor subunit beta